MTHDLAVIIPHYKDFVRLDRCLEELSACEGRKWTDVVVVHSGATDHDFEFEHRHPDTRFLRQPQPGAGLARNLGVEATSAPFLLFIDSDCRPNEDLLIMARRHAQQADIIGGRIDLFDETPGHRSGAEAFEAVFAFRQRAYVTKKHFAATANLLTTRATFEDVGPFRADGAEDQDWCLRARAKGHTISYCAAMRVRHPTRGTWQSLTQKWTRLVTEELADRQASRRRTIAWWTKLMLLPFSILPDLPRVWFSARLNGPTERILASGTLIRLRLWRMHCMLTLGAINPARTHRHSG